MNIHENVVGLEKIFIIIPHDLLEWVILVPLIHPIFELLEGNAGHDIKHNCDSLTIEDNTLENPVFGDFVSELSRLFFILLLIIRVEIFAFYLNVALFQEAHNLFICFTLKLNLHLNVQEAKNVHENVSLL